MYEGSYYQDKKHGVGYFEWESGNSYAGNYVFDERCGYGVMRWTDGSVYFGLWERGIQSGPGVMVFPDNSLKAGFFEKNVFKKAIKRLDDVEPYRDQLTEECLLHMKKFLQQES